MIIKIEDEIKRKNGETTMSASYKKLFKLLIDREMKIKESAEKAAVSQATLAKMKKDGVSVSTDVLVKICTALNCTVDDIMEILPTIDNK